MNNYLDRIHHFKGNPYEIGLAAGRALGAKLEQTINHYAPRSPSLPSDLIRILADDEIERRNEELVTAYANVACPASGEIWYTFGGYPAASAGNWQRLEWPWAV